MAARSSRWWVPFQAFPIVIVRQHSRSYAKNHGEDQRRYVFYYHMDRLGCISMIIASYVIHKKDQSTINYQISIMRIALATTTDHMTYEQHAPPRECLIQSNIRKHMESVPHWCVLKTKSHVAYPSKIVPYVNIWLTGDNGGPNTCKGADNCQFSSLMLSDWNCRSDTTNVRDIPWLTHMRIISPPRTPRHTPFPFMNDHQ